MSDERCLARGGVERIGESASPCSVEIGDWKDERVISVPDHGVAVAACLEQLTDPEHGAIKDASEVQAIGFKAVHGGRLSGAFIVNDDVLDAMAEMNAAAPAHNPPYIAAMRKLRERFPNLPLVAAFETNFHRTIPAARREYAIPREWADDLHIRKWGFHGASHRFIATRSAELLGRSDLRVISCHLGGSSSLTAIQNGKSVATTMGMTPQTGLPQNNRVGDFDAFALPLIIERTGLSLQEVLQKRRYSRLGSGCGFRRCRMSTCAGCVRRGNQTTHGRLDHGDGRSRRNRLYRGHRRERQANSELGLLWSRRPWHCGQHPGERIGSRRRLVSRCHKSSPVVGDSNE
jgi:acetate kinase